MNTKNLTARTTSCVALAAIAALVSGGLVIAAAPAQAAPVFETLYLESGGSVSASGPCSGSAGVSDIPADLPIAQNGSGTSQVSISKDRTKTGDPNDTLSSAVSEKGTASARTGNGTPKSLQLQFTGRIKAFANQPVSACKMDVAARLKLKFRFTIAQPMWATLSYDKQGPTYAEAYIYDDFADPYEELYGRIWKSSGSTTALLPAGTYSGYLEGNPYKDGISSTMDQAASGSVKIAFAPVGSAISGPSGKAQSYAALGGARSCSVHALTAKLTTSSKKVKKIKKVSFTVNGKTVKTLRGKAIKRGRSLKLPIGDTRTAAVKTTVRLTNGKTLTAKANYRACS